MSDVSYVPGHCSSHIKKSTFLMPDEVKEIRAIIN